MTDRMAELIEKLEALSGFKALPGTARELIQSYIDHEKTQIVEDLAGTVGKHAAVLEKEKRLFDPPKGKTGKKVWSSAEEADQLRRLEKKLLTHLPHKR